MRQGHKSEKCERRGEEALTYGDQGMPTAR
jgi:hypothetical protein